VNLAFDCKFQELINDLPKTAVSLSIYLVPHFLKYLFNEIFSSSLVTTMLSHIFIFALQIFHLILQFVLAQFSLLKSLPIFNWLESLNS
jgi:hypothetical protein